MLKKEPYRLTLFDQIVNGLSAPYLENLSYQTKLGSTQGMHCEGMI
jgi:hypothetical protein